MTAIEGTSKLLASGSKSHMKAESNAGEKDIFREIPLRYAGKYNQLTNNKLCSHPLVHFVAGYANEVGEAFRHMVPIRLVHLSYAVSSGYVVSHAVAQGLSTRRKQNKTKIIRTDHHSRNFSSSNHNSTSGNQKQALSSSVEPLSPTAAVLDTLLWQGLASVVVPGLTINRLCAGSRLLLNRYATRMLNQQVRRWVVTGMGLTSIPVIIRPIDW